ncbi:hypothetical protein T10_13552 [Trichinella papuae]|uniref:Uncharacterized protein n=1 Tax=Trichinella papuae TaxID=268474 RepID=A0A0V1MAA5_9BILA|nr:hypothetical protein T10_13552 [Trichinella papuae]
MESQRDISMIAINYDAADDVNESENEQLACKWWSGIFLHHEFILQKKNALDAHLELLPGLNDFQLLLSTKPTVAPGSDDNVTG